MWHLDIGRTSYIKYKYCTVLYKKYMIIMKPVWREFHHVLSLTVFESFRVYHDRLIVCYI